MFFKAAWGAAILAALSLPASGEIFQMTTTYLDQDLRFHNVIYSCIDRSDIPPAFASSGNVVADEAMPAAQSGEFLAFTGNMTVLLVGSECLDGIQADFKSTGIAPSALVVSPI